MRRWSRQLEGHGSKFSTLTSAHLKVDHGCSLFASNTGECLITFRTQSDTKLRRVNCGVGSPKKESQMMVEALSHLSCFNNKLDSYSRTLPLRLQGYIDMHTWTTRTLSPGQRTYWWLMDRFPTDIGRFVTDSPLGCGNEGSRVSSLNAWRCRFLHEVPQPSYTTRTSRGGLHIPPVERRVWA
jgi:hypothetical protein